MSIISFAQRGSISGSGQPVFHDDGSVEVTGKVVFTSAITSSYSDFVQFDAISLFNLATDLTGGIKASMQNQNSKVTLTVYSVNSNQKGSVLYKLILNETSAEEYKGTPVNLASPIGTGQVMSDQIKVLMQNSRIIVENTGLCPTGNYNLFNTTFAYINRTVAPFIKNDFINCLKGNNYMLTQPVIVELDMEDAILKPNGIKIPGIKDYDINNYFNVNRRLSVSITINDTEYGPFTPNDTIPTLNATMGDMITYKVKHFGDKPEITGVPDTWIARFGGDLMYYCTPSVTPLDYYPFIGYDSRVHTLQLRKYPEDFKLRVDDWEHSSEQNEYSWTYQAKRRTTADKEKIELTNWLKEKELPSGGIQRNNQKEGLNIQFLNYWQNFLNGSYNKYDGAAQYMMGFDDDELMYMNSKQHDAERYPPEPPGGIAKLDSLPSRGMPEGVELINDVITGYPTQNNSLNTIVTAYKKNRKIVDFADYSYTKNYNGYEIQDIGTNDQFPDGTGQGNRTAPGTIKIRAGNLVIKIPIDTKAPLTEDKGFYGSVQGNRWPAYYESNVPYSLSGLKSLNNQELDKFSMEYSYPDASGNIVKDINSLKNLNEQQKENIRQSGIWTTNFDTRTAYTAITAYYQKSDHVDPVMIGGKELKADFLLFFGDKELEGKGLGAKIWLNDFRNNQYGEYTVERVMGGKKKYVKPYIRNYTYPVGHHATFNTWDGDPHLFYDPGTEWFLSARTLAKRIPDNYLDGTQEGIDKPFLKYYLDDIEVTKGREGKDITITFGTPGSYKLRTEYRYSGNLTSYTNNINVVNYPNLPTLGETKGKIKISNPTEKEKEWLGLGTETRWKIVEIVDVLSSHKYKDGPRKHELVNRWADFNDYASDYSWFYNDQGTTVELQHPQEVTNFMSNYDHTTWFWNNWALHYSSNWRDNLPDGLPTYVKNDQVLRVRDLELDQFRNYIKDSIFTPKPPAEWQAVVPLISYTDYQGYRMRTNPSCIYDISMVWDNEHGAFSGNPILPPPELILAPDISDDDKDRQELYYDLQSRKKFLLDTDIYIRGELDVYNLTNVSPGTIFMAREELSILKE